MGQISDAVKMQKLILIENPSLKEVTELMDLFAELYENETFYNLPLELLMAFLFWTLENRPKIREAVALRHKLNGIIHEIHCPHNDSLN